MDAGLIVVIIGISIALILLLNSNWQSRRHKQKSRKNAYEKMLAHMVQPQEQEQAFGKVFYDELPSEEERELMLDLERLGLARRCMCDESGNFVRQPFATQVVNIAWEIAPIVFRKKKAQ